MLVSEQQRRDLLMKKKPQVFKKMLQIAPNLGLGIGMPIIQYQHDYRCLFHCEHCCTEKMQKRQYSEPDTRRMTYLDLKRLADEADALSLNTFVITGGEPLAFTDLDEVIAAIGPERFWIVIDTNGWLLSATKAEQLVKMGVDKIQLSVDGADAETHDAFRNKKGSWQSCMWATKNALAQGLQVLWQTVVWRGRAQTEEFIKFLELGESMGVPIYIGYAKPVGEYEGRFDTLVTPEDEQQIEELRKTYDICTHMTPSYGLDIGCIAVKRMISITRFGEVMPCPFMHVAIGNVLDEPLGDIIKRGMSIRQFSSKTHGPCWTGTDTPFGRRVMTAAYGKKKIPVSHTEVFTEEDYERP